MLVIALWVIAKDTKQKMIDLKQAEDNMIEMMIKTEQRLNILEESNEGLKVELEEKSNELDTKNQEIEKLQVQVKELSAKPKPTPKVTKTAKGSDGGSLMGTFNVSFYADTPESQGKWVGQSASGRPLKTYKTIAMGKGYPFGTKVYIPALAHLNGDGIFICEDRGGAISNGHIDVLVGSNNEARKLGRKNLKVYKVK